MTMRRTKDQEPDQRLLEVLMREHFAVADADAEARRLIAASAEERERAWQRARRAEAAVPGVARFAMVAAALLGIGVVAATMWWAKSETAAGGAELHRVQDPDPRPAKKPRDLAQFVAWLGTATSLQLRAKEAIGATYCAGPDGSFDRLDLVPLPAIVTVTGEAFAPWRDAIVASASRLEPSTQLGAWLSASFTLADGSAMGASLSAGDEVHLDPWLDGGVVRPNAALRELIAAAHQEIEAGNRRAAGIALDQGELDRLPASSAHVETRWFADGSLVERLQRFSELRSLRLHAGEGADTVNAAALLAISRLRTLQVLDVSGDALRDQDCGLLFVGPALRSLRVRGGNQLTGAGFAGASQILIELTLERCQGLTAAGLQALARDAKHLQTLRLIDCDLGEGASLLHEIPAFPSLRCLALRGKTIPGSALSPLVHSKLRSLQLVEVPVRGSDVLAFAELPSLRELAILSATIDDDASLDIAMLRNLTSLRLQNVKLTKDGLQTIQKALPQCTIDCVPGRRLFDPGRWLLP